MHGSDAARKRLHSALERAFLTDRTSHFVSPTGQKARWFFDFRSIILESETLNDIAELFWERLSKYAPFQVGALETAGIVLVSALVLKAREHSVTTSGFYVRKSRKKDGLQKMIEGTLTDEHVVLLDDGINSGKSLMRQVELLDSLGKKVVAVCVMLRFRDERFYSYFTERGIEIISLFTLDDFPESEGVDAYMRSVAHKDAPPSRMFRTHWKFESPDPSYYYVLPKSAPVLDERHVYFGADDGSMWALNKTDGSVAWRHRTLFGAGEKRIFSSPALARGTVFFGAYDGNFYALDAANGDKRWVYREADWIGSSPCVAEDLGSVFVGLEFGLWRKEGGLVALDIESGTRKWMRHLTTYAHSSPAYARTLGVVVVGSSSGDVFALDADTGDLKWQFKAQGAVRAGFAIDEERGYVCFGSEDSNVYVLDGKNGEVVYKRETLEPVYSTPLAHDGKLYVGLLDKRVLCLDLDDGEVLWTYMTSARVFASPVIGRERLYIGSNDGRLYELDPMTGAEHGYFQTTERIVNRIAFDETTGRLYVPTYANEIYCIEPQPTTAETTTDSL